MAEFYIIDCSGVVIDEADTLEDAEDIAAEFNGSYAPVEAFYRIVKADAEAFQC